MSDRQLLEDAARAAGMEVLAEGVLWPREKRGWFFNDAGGNFGLFDRGSDTLPKWNPLTDDGDALRLAVKLGLAVTPYPIYAKPKHSVIAKQYDHARYLRGESEDVRIEEIQVYGTDPCAATRRAIVRAAAAIGAAK
jgi:hypothetical protein